MNKLTTFRKEPEEKTYRCRTITLEILKNETDGRVEIQETAASGQLYRVCL